MISNEPLDGVCPRCGGRMAWCDEPDEIGDYMYCPAEARHILSEDVLVEMETRATLCELDDLVNGDE